VVKMSKRAGKKEKERRNPDERSAERTVKIQRCRWNSKIPAAEKEKRKAGT